MLYKREMRPIIVVLKENGIFRQRISGWNFDISDDCTPREEGVREEIFVKFFTSLFLWAAV